MSTRGGLRRKLTLSFAAAVAASLLGFSALVLFFLERHEAAERETSGASGEDDQAHNLRSLFWAMSLAAPVAIAGAAAFGFILARQALAPLKEAGARASAARASLDLILPVGGGEEWDQLAGTLNGLLTDARAAYQRILRFTADAAHELRTPLTTLIGETDLALRRERPAEELRASLETIRAEAGRLASLLDSLLMLARAEVGSVPGAGIALDLAEVVQSSSKAVIERAHRASVEVNVDLDLTPSPVMGDPILLAQAAENLLENAIRHGGGQVSVRLARGDAFASLTVADQGAGIADALRPLLFERFARDDASRTRGGYGLGLAIARAIASAHRGTLDLLPSERGATFELRLPLRPFAAGYAEPSIRR